MICLRSEFFLFFSEENGAAAQYNVCFHLLSLVDLTVLSLHHQIFIIINKMSSLIKLTIDDLPPEMIFELFKYLRLRDLAACSMMNRRWHSLYLSFRLDRLAVIGCPEYFYSGAESTCVCKGQMSEDKVPYRLEISNRLVDQSLLSNLKILSLWHIPVEFDLNKLNKFSQLVLLKIGEKKKRGKEPMNLNLPKLKVLVWHLPYYESPLSIDCLELSVLVYCCGSYEQQENRLTVKRPETIKQLKTNMVGPRLAPFKNVHTLVTCKFQAIQKDTLLLLPKLKKLHFNASIDELVKQGNQIDRIKQTVREFVKDVKLLRGYDFEFRFAGFQLIKTSVDEIAFGEQVDGREYWCHHYLYMKLNYNLIDPTSLDFINTFDYNRLMKLMSNVAAEIPSCFFTKFTGIHLVQAENAILDAKHFLWFLKSLGSLRKLYLIYPELDQEFYDQLPTAVPSLTCLELFEHNASQLNFNFIREFSRFSQIYLYGDVSFETLDFLIGSFGKSAAPNLAVARFGFKGLKEKSFFIDKIPFQVWKIVENRNQIIFMTKNPEEVLNFFRLPQVKQQN